MPVQKLKYRFSIRANSFLGVYLFHYYDICNNQELASGCAYGRKTQL
jgi:hypothetical protein